MMPSKLPLEKKITTRSGPFGGSVSAVSFSNNAALVGK